MVVSLLLRRHLDCARVISRESCVPPRFVRLWCGSTRRVFVQGTTARIQGKGGAAQVVCRMAARTAPATRHPAPERARLERRSRAACGAACAKCTAPRAQRAPARAQHLRRGVVDVHASGQGFGRTPPAGSSNLRGKAKSPSRWTVYPGAERAPLHLCGIHTFAAIAGAPASRLCIRKHQHGAAWRLVATSRGRVWRLSAVN
jgi:hypothetical protein